MTPWRCIEIASDYYGERIPGGERRYPGKIGIAICCIQSADRWDRVCSIEDEVSRGSIDSDPQDREVELSGVDDLLIHDREP